VGAQVDDQSVELPITAHDLASSAGSAEYADLVSLA